MALAEVGQEDPNVVNKGLAATLADAPNDAEAVLISPHRLEMSTTR